MNYYDVPGGGISAKHLIYNISTTEYQDTARNIQSARQCSRHVTGALNPHRRHFTPQEKSFPRTRISSAEQSSPRAGDLSES